MAVKKTELYSSLWASCDALRGGMDASQYKDYILTLLFMKYVTDKYKGQKYGDLTVFDKANENIMVKSMREMTLTEINQKLAKEQVKILQEVKIENLLDQGAKTGLGVSATISGAAIGSRASDPSKDKRLKKQ